MADRTDLIARLEAIAEDLSDLALDRLRESIESGDSASAAEERRITRARRSVEKAAALLSGTAESGPAD